MQAQSNDESKRAGRRSVLVLALAGAAALTANWSLNRPDAPAFEEIPGVTGFRLMRVGGISGAGFDPFVGLDAPRPAPRAIPDAQLCGTLFTAGGPGVPVASFSDYFCPYCRVLTRELAARDDAGDIAVSWHELPLLGETSELAARAALAADVQGAYPDIHRRLMRSRVVANDDYLRTLAVSAGLDPVRFVRDARSRAVQERIEVARGLAARFGFYGTPALVIGRTAVLGSISSEMLDWLIAEEREFRKSRPGSCP